jgi:anti-anti-sigma factor
MAFTEPFEAPDGEARMRSYAETLGDETVVWLTGEHDAATVEALTGLLADAITGSRRDVIVDLSGVDFMSAAPVGALVRARYLLGLQARTLVLRSPSHSAQVVLRLCDLELSPAPRGDGVVIRGAARALASFVAVPAAPAESHRTAAPAPNRPAQSEPATPSPTGEPVSRGR